MHDLFAEEEAFLQRYKSYLESIPEGEGCPRAALEELLGGYARILRQLRTLTKLSDRTTVDLNSARQYLLQKVSRDALTGVYSKGFMIEKMREYAQTGNLGAVFCVMMIDVDFFKKYNDIYGHPMGDVCLKAVACALSECLCEIGGFVARYGGEEFVVVLIDTDESTAYALGDRLLAAVEAKAIPHAQSTVSEHVTISIGSATGVRDIGFCPEDYIEAADRALYQSKQNGRNRITRLKLGDHPL